MLTLDSSWLCWSRSRAHSWSLNCRHLCQCLWRRPVLLLLGSQDRLQSVSSTRPHRSSPTPPSRWCSPAIIAQLSICRHCLRRCQWMNSHAASPECCTRSSCRVRHAPLLAGTTVQRARQRVRHRAITTDRSTAMTCVSVCGGRAVFVVRSGAAVVDQCALGCPSRHRQRRQWSRPP